jgi:hypothetical protein
MEKFVLFLGALVLAAQAQATVAADSPFVQKGAGSVARSVADKLGDFVNVKDKGAKCDGMTNDTAAIQSAVDAGGTVQLPSGVCLVSSITLPSNVTLVGQGNFSELKRIPGASVGAVVLANGASKVTVANLTVNGNSQRTTGVHSNLHVTGSSDVLIDNVRAVNSLLHGISVTRSTDNANQTISTIRNSRVLVAARYGIEAEDTPRIVIENNRITRTGSDGILVYGRTTGIVKNAVINGNSVVDAGGSGIAIPFVNGGTALTPGVEEVTLIGNTVETSALNGYLIQGRFATVTGNTASRNGVTMNHQGFVINVMGVTATGNTASRNAGVGIDFGDCKRVIASSNLVEENGIIGIEINSTEDFVVTGNVLINNNKTSKAGDLGAGILAHLGTGGYRFLGKTINGSISNNVVRGGAHQKFGIKTTADTGNIRIMGNDAVASGTVRDFEILTPTGQFIESGNVVVAPGYAAAPIVTIPQVGSNFLIGAGGTINDIVTDAGTYQIGRTITLSFTGTATVNNGRGNVYLSGSTFKAVKGSTLTLIRADADRWSEISRRQ